MKDLLLIYKECILSDAWAYYPLSPIVMDVLSDAEKGRCFITSYLRKGGKSELKIFEYIQKLEDIRIRHIVSCFFLGVAIYKECSKLQGNIKSFLSKIPANPCETTEKRFLYVWMLISLFHDFGYAIENGLVSMQGKEFNELMKAFPRRPRSIPMIYNKKVIKNYNKYRICRFGVNDHGITGGIKLYKELCELRDVMEEVDAHHYWEKPLEKDFCIAAWTIVCHNIYMIKKGVKNELCYTCKKIEQLIYNNDRLREIKAKKHPLLFLFCLIDTIEPIKTVTDYRWLKKISIRVGKDNIFIDHSKLCETLRDNYCSKIKQMDEWLTDVDESGTMIKI